MLSTLLTILPVFILIAVGFLAVRSGYVDGRLADHLNAFTVKIAVPVLLFRAMSDLDFSQAFNPGMLAGFYLGGFVSFFAAIVFARTVFKRRPGESVAVGFCALFSNTVLLGIPIMQRVYGSDAMAPVFGILALHAGTMYTLGMVSMEVARADGRSLGATLQTALRSIIVNPLMIGVICGLLFNLSGLEQLEVLQVPIDMLAGAAIPAALVGLGAALTRYSMKADFAESLMVTSLSLFIHPAIALVITHFWLALPPEWVRAAVIVAAMPPGMNVYIFALLYDRAVSLAASVIIVATAVSVLTISGWISLVNWLLA